MNISKLSVLLTSVFLLHATQGNAHEWYESMESCSTRASTGVNLETRGSAISSQKYNIDSADNTSETAGRLIRSESANTVQVLDRHMTPEELSARLAKIAEERNEEIKAHLAKLAKERAEHGSHGTLISMH